MVRVAVVAVILLPLTGCGSPSSTEAEEKGVVTSIYPLQYVAERIVGDRVAVTNLTAPGQESHDFELGIEQSAQLSEAGTVVHLAGFQPAVDEALAQAQPDRVVDAADHAALLPVGGHGQEHGEDDPHFWLDPLRLADVAAAVEETLSEAHPDLAEAFATNLEELTADLEAVDREYRRGLERCEVDTVVVSHDAFGYLAKYGLQLQPIAGITPGAEPSPARLAELSRLIADTGVTTVFSETLVDPATAETLSAELGLETAVLDPIEGLSENTGDEDYLTLMRANLEALRAAGRCR